MSTTNTEKTWNWYIRQKGKNFYLGIVDSDGAAPTTADLNIDIYYTKLSEVSDYNDTVPIPDEYMGGFIKGIVYEYLLIEGGNDRRINFYKKEYDETVARLRLLIAAQTASSGRIKPVDLRMD